MNRSFQLLALFSSVLRFLTTGQDCIRNPSHLKIPQTLNPKPSTLNPQPQIWRKAPADADFPEHSYSLMGQTRLVADKPGPIRLVLPRDQQVTFDQLIVVQIRPRD
jgi:hypothetical protein